MSENKLILANYCIDRDTGYLTTKDGYMKGVKATAKVAFLNSFRETANFRAAARIAGLTPHEIHTHFGVDQKFKAAYDDAVNELCDNVEANLYRMAMKTPVAAFGFLKAYRNRVWGDKKESGGKDDKESKIESLLSKLQKEGQLIDVNEEKSGNE